MENKKKQKTIGMYIIASAIIWGASILGCSLKLKGTFTEIAFILNGAAAIHLILIMVPLALQFKKLKEGKE